MGDGVHRAIAIRRASNPIFELVGVYVTSDAKHEHGAGEVAGIAPLGLVCTTDKQSILALDADCVNYARSTTTSTRCARSCARARTSSALRVCLPAGARSRRDGPARAACREGGTSLHGAGIHPGFIGDVFALTGCAS